MKVLYICLAVCLEVVFSSELQEISLSEAKDFDRSGLNNVRESKDDLKTLVEKFIEKALKVVANNDPYEITKADLNYNGYGIESEGYIKNLQVSFISTASINNLIVDNSSPSLQFGFDLSLKQIQVIGNFNWTFNVLSMFPLSISGDVGLLLNGLNMSLSTTFNELENKVLQLRNLDTKTTLNDSKVEIEQMFGNGKLGTFVGLILTDILPSTVNENPQAFAMLNIGLKALLNSIMASSGITLDYVIDVMEHFIQ